MNRSLVIASSLAFTSAAAFVGQLSADLAPAARQRTSHASAGFFAQPLGPDPRPIGPDAILGDVNGPTNWSALTVAGVPIAAYSMGLTVCNVGATPMGWVQATFNHPIYSQGIYRVKTADGSSCVEQIGLGWQMHSFCALQGALCSPCQPACGGCCTVLAVGCSNPETSHRAGAQSLLGPRYQVNVSTGVFPYPFDVSTPASTVLHRRVQVKNSDIDPALNPAAFFFAEAGIVHPGDAQAGNGANNYSYRKLNVGSFTGTMWPLSSSGATVRMLPAIHAWKTIDPSVIITDIDVPGDGRFVVGHDVTNLGDGRWRYEYAIYNINSHRSAQSFSILIGEGTEISGLEFHGPLYHSGDKPDNVPWSASVANGHVTWSTPPHTGPAPAGNDLSAYALRFGTLYSFRFDANAAPHITTATLGLFRPGAPESMVFTLTGPIARPPCSADLTGSGGVDGMDLALLLAAWGPCGKCSADLNLDGLVNGLDLAILLAQWGPCAG